MIRSVPNHELKEGSYAMAIQPLYDMNVAANLIPVKLATLKQHLRRHHYPQRYRTFGRFPARRVRLLTESEILQLRKFFLRGNLEGVT